DVAAGTGKAFNQACFDRVVSNARHDDRNRLGRILGRSGQYDPSCYHDDIDVETHQLGSKLGSPIGLPLRIPVIDGDVLSFYITQVAKCQANPVGTGGLITWVLRR